MYPLLACGVCFGSTDPRMTLLLLGMLSVPFLMVGGMTTLLYYKGVFRTVEPAPGDSSAPKNPA